MKSRLSILFCFVFCLSAMAQETPSKWEFGATGYGGFLMAHHPEIQYIVEGHIKGFELQVGQRTDGRKDWHHNFNFPSFGLTLGAANLGSSYLGNAYSARWFIDLPLNKSRWLGLKMDLGAGYIEKPFSTFENIHNSAIGSHMNVTLALGLYGRIKLGESFDLKPGIGIQHYSNGALKMPNSGINVAVAQVSLVYHQSRALPERIVKELEPSKIAYFVGSSFGLKEINPIGGKKYEVLNIYGQGIKRISPKSSLGAELGMNYNASLEDRMNEIEKGTGETADNYRIMISAIHQLHFDPFGLRFQVGTYIAPKFTEDGPVFFKYHVYYDFKDWQIFVGLKSHFAKADNGEIGINYRIK